MGAVPYVIMAGLGMFQAKSAQDLRAEERKAIREAEAAQSALIDVAVEHTETTAEEMRETATETIAASRGQIEAQIAFMGGRGARSGAALEEALSRTETEWLEDIDKETQLILDELEVKREVVGAQASLADISSKIAFTQNIFNAFSTMITPLLDVQIQPGSPTGGIASGARGVGAGLSTRPYKPPRYGGL